MKDPKIKVEIKHSMTKSAWNVVGTKAGAKYKIARIPYLETERDRQEAYEHAEFIAICFNRSTEIIKLLKGE